MSKKIMYTAMILFIMSFSLFALSGCSEKASKFTEEEHIQRVTERIEKKFMTDKFEYTGFEVYPLYNENNNLKYFLVEFEPYEFIYVLLRDEQQKGFSWLGASTSMYRLLGTDSKYWSPYIIDSTNSQNPPNTDKCWIVDENGDKIVYKKSPYSIADIKREKRYLLHIDDRYVPAVRRNGMFENLISHDEVEIVNGHFTKEQAYSTIFSYPSKKRFDL